MTDHLDRLASTAAPLLRRVDAALAVAGAPPADPIWPLLRRVRALPSEAVAAVTGWRAPPLAEAATPLSALGRRYSNTFADLPAAPPWQGAAAEAYGRQWSHLRVHMLGPGEDSLVGRLDGTARYLEATADWVTRSRRALAVALAEVLGSVEAVTLVTGSGPPGPGAARVGAHVLAPVATAGDEGWALHDEWRARLPELPLPASPGAAPSRTGTLRVGE